MIIRFTKRIGKADIITCIRKDGSETYADMPKEAVLPHDAIHFVVETTLGWRDAFFGQIARGASLNFAATKLHEKRSDWEKYVHAMQSEALVECLQAEQWGGASKYADFMETLAAACKERRVEMPAEINEESLTGLRMALRAFGAEWRPLPTGQRLERMF